MQESIIKATNDFIKSQMPEFEQLIADYYDTDTGFTESLERRLAQVGYDKKTDKKWYALMWNMGKPEILSHRPKIFRVREVQWVNNLGDLVSQEDAQDPVTLRPKKGYSAVSPDYRYTVVQSVFNLDYIFNSVSNASLFQELFTLRIYLSRSFYATLPILGKTCIYVDDIAMGEIDKFDRIAQGTLLSLPIDLVLTYPLISPVVPPEDQPKYTIDRKPLITDINFRYRVDKTHTEDLTVKRKREIDL